MKIPYVLDENCLTLFFFCYRNGLYKSTYMTSAYGVSAYAISAWLNSLFKQGL